MSVKASPQRELHHFVMLDRDQQAAAIRRLAASGVSDYGIAAATRLSVEFVRTVIGPRRPHEQSAQ